MMEAGPVVTQFIGEIDVENMTQTHRRPDDDESLIDPQATLEKSRAAEVPPV